MSNWKENLITSLILGVLISSLVLIAPLTGNSQPTASVSFMQTTDCPDKDVTSVSPTTGDASTPQKLDIVVSNATYITSNGGFVIFLAKDVFAVDSADPNDVIAATTSSRELLPGCCVAGFNPLLFRATFNFGSANVCKAFKFYVTTECFGTTAIGQSEPGGLFTLDCPFDAFTAKVKIEKGPLTSDDKFDVQGTFILAPATDGVDPLTEDLTLQLGSFSATIPAGSFAQANNGRSTFTGVIGGVSLDVEIRPLRGGGFDLKASGVDADLDQAVNPLPIKLIIGGDSGSTAVTARIK
jgi:hypothetical protein